MKPMDEKDLRVDIYSNGTGIVAVRIVHTPTGTVVTADSKREAMEQMREALRAREEQAGESNVNEVGK